MSNALIPAPGPGDEEQDPSTWTPGADDYAALSGVESEAGAVAHGLDAAAWSGAMVPGKVTREPRSKYSIVHDRYDERAWKQVRKDNPDLDKVLKEGKPAVMGLDDDGNAIEVESATSVWPHPNELALDLYSALYKTYPEWEDNLDPAYAINQVAMEAVMDTPEYDTLHTSTQLDEFAAGIGISVLSERIMRDRDLMEAAKAIAEAQAPEQQEDETDSEFAQRLQQWKNQQALARRKLRMAMKQAAQQAQQDVQQANDAASAFGGGMGLSDLERESRTMNAQEKARIARKVLQNQQLRQIVQFAGRMKRLAVQSQQSRVDYIPDEVYSVTQGSDLSRVLPSEVMKLSDPTLRMLFLRDFIEARLPIYELNRPAKEMRGPIVVAIDESGSMSGTPDAWAKAAFLALNGVAKSQERDIRLIHFSSGRQVKVHDILHQQGGRYVERTINARGEESAKELPSSPESLMDIVLHFYGGGTDYDPWMGQALNAIEQSTWNKADVLCISDGAAFISDEMITRWRDTRAAKGFRCYGILIQDWGGAGTLEDISDEVASLCHRYVGDGARDTDILLRAFSV